MSPEYRSDSPLDFGHARLERREGACPEFGALVLRLMKLDGPSGSTNSAVHRAGSVPVCLTAPIRTRPSGSLMLRSRTGYRQPRSCLLYTSDAADEEDSVD